MAVFRNLREQLSCGFDVLGFDFSGSGLSSGEFVTLGINEKEDLKAVLAFVKGELKY
jgi:alpha/beta superfamily hydrolase